jgi:hypothetical protein
MNAKQPNNDQEPEERHEVVPSELDEMTHSELRMLYHESAQSVLFAKNHQWKTVGSTLVFFVVLILIGKVFGKSQEFVNNLQALVLLATPASILVLIIYQFWQHTEHEKQAGIARDFSNVFREIRALKSRVEANVHRYTLLMFMIIIEGIGAFITFVTLSTIQWYR